MPKMTFDTQVYAGPTLFCHLAVVRGLLGLGELIDLAPGRVTPAFTEALTGHLPALKGDAALSGVFERGGNVLGQAMLSAAAELQRTFGHHIRFTELRAGAAPGTCELLTEYEDQGTGRRAMILAARLVVDLAARHLDLSLDRVPNFDFQEHFAAFQRYGRGRNSDLDARYLISAAKAREIPWYQLARQKFVLGHGKYQRRFMRASTERTSYVSLHNSNDKMMIHRLLAMLGLPVPQQRVVFNENDAVEAAEKIGFPVVLKPRHADFGHGVTVNPPDAAAVRTAFNAAREYSREVMVESMIRGEEHRMFVVNGELIAAAHRIPGQVIGDGKHTIRELVDILNQDPRRREGESGVLSFLEFNAEARRKISEAGLTPDHVPAAGEPVVLRGTSNLSTGGTSIDLTDLVHPDNRRMAIDAALALRLDIAGVDYLTTDISKSYKETGGAICEVNITPGMRMHMDPFEGTRRDVAAAILDYVFPPGTPVRVPTAAIAGSGGAAPAGRMLSRILQAAGSVVGTALADGAFVDGQRTRDGDCASAYHAYELLRDPRIDTAVLQTASDDLDRNGLGVEFCDVGAVLDLSDGAAGEGAAQGGLPPEAIVVKYARTAAVLNADDLNCLALRDATDAASVYLVSTDAENLVLRDHLQAGGRAVFAEPSGAEAAIVLFDGEVRETVIAAESIAADFNANHPSLLFAVAMAHAMGVGLDTIAGALRG